MDFKNQISELVNEIADLELSTIKKKIVLYGTGIGAKLLNAEYALGRLSDLNIYPDDISSTIPDICVKDQIHFFVDSFFAFSYSSYDVLAQVINQKLQLGLNEYQVSIKRIKNHINSTSNLSLYNKIEDLLKKNHFKNLDKYRNCSTHRRQIYLETKTILVSGTPGYSSTSLNTTSITRVLCDDPITLTPKITQGRELIAYSTNMFNKIKDDIISILKEM